MSNIVLIEVPKDTGILGDADQTSKLSSRMTEHATGR